MPRRLPWLSLLLLSFVFIATPSLEASDGDQVHFGQRITVSEDEAAGDLVCIGCSIQVEGSCGDVVALGGSITLNGSVKGDAVVIGGPMRLGENASVSGDVVTIGGRLWRHPNAVVSGNVASQSGTLMILALIMLPLIPVVLVIALIVWLLGRNRPPQVPARV
jgi:hypothetical protein